MKLDEITQAVGLDYEEIDAEHRIFRRDFAFFKLSPSEIAYETSRPLKSRHYFNKLSESFPSNRFITGFRFGFHERSLLELKAMENEEGELFLSQTYSSEESPFFIELLRNYLMATIA